MIATVTMSSISENPRWEPLLERSTIFMADSGGDALIVRFRARPVQLAPTSGANAGNGRLACMRDRGTKLEAATPPDASPARGGRCTRGADGTPRSAVRRGNHGQTVLRPVNPDPTGGHEHHFNGAPARLAHGKRAHLQRAAQHARVSERCVRHIVLQRAIGRHPEVLGRGLEPDDRVRAVDLAGPVEVPVDDEALVPATGVRALPPSADLQRFTRWPRLIASERANCMLPARRRAWFISCSSAIHSR